MAKATRRRLDRELVRRRLACSTSRALQMIESGTVLVDGAPAQKASRLVAPDQNVTVVDPPQQYVSRGGQKLAAALDAFAVDPAGLRCLDAGASTGGFSHCLVQRGAAWVLAVDVGTNQAHEKIRDHERVTVRERTDIRDLTGDHTNHEPFDLIVADLSFISLKSVMGHLTRFAHAETPMLLLAKPQFEAERAEASKGRGVIRHPEVWRRVLTELAAAGRAEGLVLTGVIVSPITGAKGNVEFFTRFHSAASTLDPEIAVPPAGDLISEAISQAVLHAEARDR